jgi:predicted nucleic acid-binding protein
MIFYDTGAWYALTVPGDKNAPAARGLQTAVARGVHGAIVTTNFVVNEAATLVRMETDTETAVRLARGVLGRPTITLVWIGSDHFNNALALFESHRDKRWSFTDCTSFAIMRELGIAKAFSFDRNFEQAGFDRLP